MQGKHSPLKYTERVWVWLLVELISVSFFGLPSSCLLLVQVDFCCNSCRLYLFAEASRVSWCLFGGDLYALCFHSVFWRKRLCTGTPEEGQRMHWELTAFPWVDDLSRGQGHPEPSCPRRKCSDQHRVILCRVRDTHGSVPLTLASGARLYTPFQWQQRWASISESEFRVW